MEMEKQTQRKLKLSNTAIQILLILGIILFAALWMFKPRVVELPPSTTVIDSLQRVINTTEADILKKDSIIDTLLLGIAVREDVIDKTKKELSQLKASSDEYIKKVEKHTLQEDSLFFAVHSGEPVIIEREKVIISPMQLKYANIKISEVVLAKSEIELQNKIIADLEIVNEQQAYIIIIKDELILGLENINETLEYKVTFNAEQYEKQKKVDKKKNRKKKLRTGVIGGVIGAAAMVVVLAIAG